MAEPEYECRPSQLGSAKSVGAKRGWTRGTRVGERELEFEFKFKFECERGREAEDDDHEDEPSSHRGWMAGTGKFFI